MDTGAINNALTLTTRVIQLGKRATHVDYEEALQAAREAMLEQKELNLNFRDEIRELKEKLQVAGEYRLDKSVYWAKEDINREQPFCPACYSVGKIVPLQKSQEKRDKTQTWWHCPNKNCNASLNPWDYQEPIQTYDAFEMI